MAKARKSGTAPDDYTDDIDPEQMAQQELAAIMLPTPDDIMEDLSPMAALYYWDRMGWGVYTDWVAWLSQMDDAAKGSAESAVRVVQVIAQALGELDAICSEIGLLPPQGDRPPAP